MRSPALLVLACATVLIEPAAGQGLPYRVTIVDWTPQALASQDRAYRQAPIDREVLFCVTVWRRVADEGAFDHIVIEEVEMARMGSRTRIANVAEECLGPDGAPQPMIHTHADGNCQQSPADLVTLVARGAPFEGVQCGRRHFVWGFPWQVRAIAEAAMRGEAREHR